MREVEKKMSSSTKLDASDGVVASVSNLRVSFPSTGDNWRTVVRGITFDVFENDRIAIVGESGSGKTMVGLALLGLSPEQARIEGTVSVAGISPQTGSSADLKRLRGSVATMVFQDPLTSLNPVRSVGSQITESIRRHSKVSRKGARLVAIAAMTKAGIPAAAERFSAFPHELSGGLRQRVVIALALANDPALIVADEPTTALDTTIQAQILEVFRSGVQGSAMLLITHDLAVAAEVCTRVFVMYAGRIVETGDIARILKSPQHPYTHGLLQAAPSFDAAQPNLIPISGGPPPDPGAMIGCRFAPRCELATNRCRTEEPQLVNGVACWYPGKVSADE